MPAPGGNFAGAPSSSRGYAGTSKSTSGGVMGGASTSSMSAASAAARSGGATSAGTGARGPTGAGGAASHTGASGPAGAASRGGSSAGPGGSQNQGGGARGPTGAGGAASHTGASGPAGAASRGGGGGIMGAGPRGPMGGGLPSHTGATGPAGVSTRGITGPAFNSPRFSDPGVPGVPGGVTARNQNIFGGRLLDISPLSNSTRSALKAGFGTPLGGLKTATISEAIAFADHLRAKGLGPLTVNSAWGSRKQQDALRAANPSAAAAGRIAVNSPHTPGKALDVAVPGLSHAELAKELAAFGGVTKVMGYGRKGSRAMGSHVHMEVASNPSTYSGPVKGVGYIGGQPTSSIIAGAASTPSPKASPTPNDGWTEVAREALPPERPNALPQPKPGNIGQIAAQTRTQQGKNVVASMAAQNPARSFAGAPGPNMNMSGYGAGPMASVGNIARAPSSMAASGMNFTPDLPGRMSSPARSRSPAPAAAPNMNMAGYQSPMTGLRGMPQAPGRMNMAGYDSPMAGVAGVPSVPAPRSPMGPAWAREDTPSSGPFDVARRESPRQLTGLEEGRTDTPSSAYGLRTAQPPAPNMNMSGYQSPMAGVPPAAQQYDPLGSIQAPAAQPQPTEEQRIAALLASWDTPAGRKQIKALAKTKGWAEINAALKAYEKNKGWLNSSIFGSPARAMAARQIGTPISDAMKSAQNALPGGIMAMAGMLPASRSKPTQVASANRPRALGLENYNPGSTQVAGLPQQPSPQAPYSPGVKPGAPAPGLIGPQPYMGNTYSFSVPGRPKGTRRDAIAPRGVQTAGTAALGAIGLPLAGTLTDGLQKLGARGRQGRLGNNPGGPYTDGMDHGYSYGGGSDAPQVAAAARKIMARGGPRTPQEQEIVQTAIDFNLIQTPVTA